MGVYDWFRDQIQQFAEPRSVRRITTEIATRERAYDYTGLIGLLPDPDPVLLKRGDGSEVLDDLLGDAHVMSVVQTRKVGTLCKEWHWQPGKEENREPSSEAKALRDAFAANLKDLDVYNLNAEILNAPLYGNTPLELIWKPSGGRIDLVDIRALPTHWFSWDVKNQPKFRSQDNPWDGEDLPPNKFVFARHFPTYKNPFGLRLLSRCLWPVTFKKGGIKFWIQFAEKYGMPFLVARTGQDTDDEEQTSLLSKLKLLVQDAVAVITEETEIDLVEAAEGHADVHERLKDSMNAEISKVILGQTLITEQGERGARSLGEVHERVLDQYQESDQKLVNHTWNRIAQIYAGLNAEGILPPRHGWVEEEDLQKERSERDKDLKEVGVRLTKPYFVRVYGFQEDDLEVTEPPEIGMNGNRFPSNGIPGAFSENPAENQRTVDDFVTEEIRKGTKISQEQAEKILEMVRASKSYEEIQDRLSVVFAASGVPEAFPVLMERALMAADMYGRLSIEEEGGRA